MIHIFHHNDFDGMMSAAVAMYHIGAPSVTSEPRTAKLHRVDYGDHLNIDAIQSGDEVYILDFSFPKDALLKVIETAHKTVWIDHHKTAIAKFEEELGGRDFGDKFKHYVDVTKSGCLLTWEFLAPPEKKEMPPIAVLMVNDYDLWKFALPHTKSFCAYLKMEGDNILAYKNTLFHSIEALQNEILMGSVVLRYEDTIVNNAIKMAKVSPEKYKGLSFVELNCTVLTSQVGHALLNAFPDVDFAVIYQDNNKNGITTHSFRSRAGSDIDVSQIAKDHGGGGHKHAAGCIHGLSQARGEIL